METNLGAQDVVVVKYAGFWSRLIAGFLDGLLLLLMYCFAFLLAYLYANTVKPGSFQPPNWLKSSAISPTTSALVVFVVLALVLITIVYEPFFVGKFGRTPGKKAMGIRIVKPDGAAVGYGVAILRTICKTLFYSVPLIGTPLALISGGFVVFHKRKQSLHDLACNTVTVIIPAL